MASRSRPRNGSTKGERDEHEEEQQIWETIKTGLRELAELQKRQIEVYKEIIALEVAAAGRAKNDEGGATFADIKAIQELYREHLKLAEDEKRMLDEGPHDIINRLEILKGLRDASSESQMLSAPGPGPRSLSASKPRKPKPLARSSSVAPSQTGSQSAIADKDEEDRRGGERADRGDRGERGDRGDRGERGGGSGGGGGNGGGSGGSGGGTGSSGLDGTSDTPANPIGRLKGSSSSVRSSSVASRQEGTGDRELRAPSSSAPATNRSGGSEDTAGSIKGTSPEHADKLVKGAEVAYKQTKPKDDSQWIQCTITNVRTGGDSTRRFEVQDPVPENGGSRPRYKTSAQMLILIPGENENLPDHPPGKQVLAKYPDTTAFYLAEVIRNKKEKGDKGKTLCVLRFQDDADKEHVVQRRFVLGIGGK